MNDGVDGDNNIVSGRDSIVQHVHQLSERIDRIADIFSRIDREFSRVTGAPTIVKRDQPIMFSSEALCTSLASLGIPISIALDVVESVVPLLRGHISARETNSAAEVSTNDVKMCVLHALSGLIFRSSEANTIVGQEQVVTWSTAYVRRYGGSNLYLKVIDHGVEVDLNFEYLKENFVPHLLGGIVGQDGEDVIGQYRKFFSAAVVEKMASEIMSFSSSLNLYSIRYKTLYHLSRDIVLTAPHPWIVTPETMDAVLSYNAERALHHFQVISANVAQDHPDHFRPSAHECAAHLCATLLAYYGCMLGVESRYGLVELIRVCEIRKSNGNLVLWSYCGLDKFESDLKRNMTNVITLELFLRRIQSSLSISFAKSTDMKDIVSKCRKLGDLISNIIGRPIFS